MGLTRIAKNAAATVSHTWYVGETPTDPTGTPTYSIVDANGTAVASGNATVVTGEGRTTAALAAQTITRLLTVTWVATVGGSSVTEVDQVEVVGGFLFSLVEARNSDTSLADTSKYTSADLAAGRLEVEQELEEICDRAFVPRYARLVLDGSGISDLVLGGVEPAPPGCSADLRSLRRASVAPQVDETFVDLTAGQLAAVAVRPNGVLRRTDGLTWYEGYANVVVEYEYGWDGPPTDLKRAALTRLRSRLNMARSGIPDRATSYTMDSGGTYRLDLPGEWKTGIPDVDAIYARYSRRSRSGKAVPYSRTLDYTPQRWSLFHGARG